MPDIFTANPHQHKKEVSVNKPTQVAALSNSLPSPDQKSFPGMFSAYCPNPTGITFTNQEGDETVLLFLRKHFITNFSWVFYSFLLIIIPPILSLLNTVFTINLFSLPTRSIPVLLAAYYVLVFNYAFIQFTIWFFHVGIVTQKRLVDLDIDNILSYDLAETRILDIVDVDYSQKGFFQSFFRFGDVLIQTEAIKPNFEFEECPNPSTVSDIITDLRPRGKGEKS